MSGFIFCLSSGRIIDEINASFYYKFIYFIADDGATTTSNGWWNGGNGWRWNGKNEYGLMNVRIMPFKHQIFFNSGFKFIVFICILNRFESDYIG